MRPGSASLPETKGLVKNYFQIREILAVGGTGGLPASVWSGFVRSPAGSLYAWGSKLPLAKAPPTGNRLSPVYLSSGNGCSSSHSRFE